ncbi:MAG: NAD(P)-binding domain-containing protein [Planctomycetaceae bacterium]|nr:NAD(P)-binding domain-containing protein [Planctomycetaceae bacterium]
MIHLGIIGVGIIASAVAKGLKAKYGDGITLHLSPRNAGRAEALRAAYPNVTVASSNQEVLDRSDWVVISVLPASTEAVLRALTFHPRHKIISLVSQPKMAALETWINEYALLCRVIPQTFIENRTGPILLYPELPEAVDLLSGLGTLVTPATEDEFNLAQTLSCAMGPTHRLLDEIVTWMASCGLPPERSSAYLLSLLGALAGEAAKTSPQNLASLWQEVTPGGLNEQVIRSLEGEDAFMAWVRALDAVRKKII